jgi:hypothetical protein
MGLVVGDLGDAVCIEDTLTVDDSPEGDHIPKLATRQDP